MTLQRVAARGLSNNPSSISRGRRVIGDLAKNAPVVVHQNPALTRGSAFLQCRYFRSRDVKAMNNTGGLLLARLPPLSDLALGISLHVPPDQRNLLRLSPEIVNIVNDAGNVVVDDSAQYYPLNNVPSAVLRDMITRTPTSTLCGMLKAVLKLPFFRHMATPRLNLVMDDSWVSLSLDRRRDDLQMLIYNPRSFASVLTDWWTRATGLISRKTLREALIHEILYARDSYVAREGPFVHQFNDLNEGGTLRCRLYFKLYRRVPSNISNHLRLAMGNPDFYRLYETRRIGVDEPTGAPQNRPHRECAVPDFRALFFG